MVLLGFIFPDISLPLLGGFIQALRETGLLYAIEMTLTCGVLLVVVAFVIGCFGPSPEETKRMAAEKMGMMKDPDGDGYITIEEMDRRYDEIRAVLEQEGLLSVEERNRRCDEVHARHMAEAARRQERNRLYRIEQQLRELQRQRGD